MGIAIERLVALLLSVSTAVPQDDKLEIAGANMAPDDGLRSEGLPALGQGPGGDYRGHRGQ